MLVERRAAACILLISLLAASCNQTGMKGRPDARADGTYMAPPLTSLESTDPGNVHVGRLWVLPNPIRFRPEWAAPPGGDGQQVGVDFLNIGSEDLYVDRAYIVGSAAFVLPDLEAGYGMPIPLAAEECCDAASGVFLGLDYRPELASGEVAKLVLETGDPTSPGIEVPIVLDHAGALTPDDPMRSPHGFESHVLVKPNPIRFASGGPSEVEVCIALEGAVPPVISETWVSGPGLSLLAGAIEPNVLIRYSPEAEGPVDGALVIEWTDSWGDGFTLAVPILVR